MLIEFDTKEHIWGEGVMTDHNSHILCHGMRMTRTVISASGDDLSYFMSGKWTLVLRNHVKNENCTIPKNL